jgi:hypothetical protein
MNISQKEGERKIINTERPCVTITKCNKINFSGVNPNKANVTLALILVTIKVALFIFS